MKKLNAVLAILSIIVIIIAMLMLCGVIRSQALPAIFLILGVINIGNGIRCYRREERNEFKIFMLSGIFIMVVALFSQSFK